MAKPDTSIEMPSMAGLVRLSHHRWLVPLVAEIGHSGGERFAVLTARLQISGPSLRRALAAAEEANLVMPNPGHGHPLRPEYLLTPWGEAIAAECLEVVKCARARTWLELVARKWSLPVLAAVQAGCHRYSHVAQALPTATPRALANALDDLTKVGCMERDIIDDRPPRPAYSVGSAGRRLAQATLALALATAD